jgi:hypothetical protein
LGLKRGKVKSPCVPLFQRGREQEVSPLTLPSTLMERMKMRGKGEENAQVRRAELLLQRVQG